MARNQNVRLRPYILKADQDAYITLQSLSDYAPVNPNFSKDIMAGLLGNMHAAQQDEVNIQNALDASRDKAVQAEWDFHNAMLGVKTQVLAQFGDNSDQAQAMGLTKKSERKTPGRKPKAGA